MSLILRLTALVVFTEIAVAHQCPGGKSVCQDTATCCPIGSDIYGCCPMQDAVCCSDYTHCCPHGTRCDVEHRQCLHDENATLWMKQQMRHLTERRRRVLKAAIKNEQSLRICGDRSTPCSGVDNSCCRGASGEARCCPFKNAVCCSGTNHCCPQGYRCEEGDGSCVLEGSTFLSVNFWTETSVPSNDDKEFMKCGVGRVCPSDSTCCAWAVNGDNEAHTCCPFRQGECCGTRCCPAGFRCVGGLKCEKLKEQDESLDSDLSLIQF